MSRISLYPSFQLVVAVVQIASGAAADADGMRERRYAAACQYALDAFLHRHFISLHVALCRFVQVLLESLVESRHVAFLDQDTCKMRTSGHAASLGFHFLERDIQTQRAQPVDQSPVPVSP